MLNRRKKESKPEKENVYKLLSMIGQKHNQPKFGQINEKMKQKKRKEKKTEE